MNNTAFGVQLVGWGLVIFGTVFSIAVAVNAGNQVTGLAGIIVSVALGTLLIGFGEIIYLVNKLVENKIAPADSMIAPVNSTDEAEAPEESN
ncbi:hypothetical protein CLHUN_04430 [Ruminiclostridium hungatei]|uniref:Uncharacterized protein n=1 Tax=Ruminiclostridium hungatei TaxID=48256 RepID=A0A1V4SPY4_RUMHU|nr:hypothetical protein [Ruminiclostridium hungatei]OPX45968.1 hypothetical protein CLHUN_04430 [Ruminiclostridium hungatei]